jgi:hypothetical protein
VLRRPCAPQRIVTDGSDLEAAVDGCGNFDHPENHINSSRGSCSWTALHPQPSRVQITAADDLWIVPP